MERSLSLSPQTAIYALPVERGNHVPLPYALISPADSRLWRTIRQLFAVCEKTIEVSELAGGKVRALCGERVILEGTFLLEGEVGGSAQSLGLDALAFSHGVLEEGGCSGLSDLLESQGREGAKLLLLHFLFCEGDGAEGE